MRTLTIIGAGLALAACNSAADTAADTAEANAARLADQIEASASDMETRLARVNATSTIPKDQSRAVCKAAMAQLFGHSPSIMSASGSDEMTRVTYRRPDDGKRFTNDCKIEGDRIVWRSVDATPGAGVGPWRTRDEDEIMTAAIDGSRVVFTIRYSDGSKTTESQPLS